jgi:hypothetical protein
MTNEQYKIEFQKLKDELIDNYAVYHERVTLLIQLTQFEIGEKGVRFKAKIIKPLHKEHAEQNNLYKYMMAKDEISFSASYQFGSEENWPLLSNKRISRPYCPFMLWLDPELTAFVAQNEDEITKQIPKYILWSEDWTVVGAN